MVLVLGFMMEVAAGADSRYVRTLERVLTLLPKQPEQVVVLDPSQTKGDVRTALLMMDAFVMKGVAVVYVTSHSPVLQAALNGSSLHEHVLATIIWHEMAHLNGADEREAQRCEETLWKQYVMDERVDRGDGLRYLTMLTQRRSIDATVHDEAVKALRGSFMAKPIAIIRPTRKAYNNP